MLARLSVQCRYIERLKLTLLCNMELGIPRVVSVSYINIVLLVLSDDVELQCASFYVFMRSLCLDADVWTRFIYPFGLVYSIKYRHYVKRIRRLAQCI